jgi:transposase
MKIEIPQRLCHLPLVMDVLRRCKVLEVIDKAIPQHALSEVSTGECVAVILCGVYVGAHSLWRIRERLAPYDMVTVMQDPTFDLERFPEERLAKALDDLYEFNLDKLMTGLALEAIRQYSLDTSFLHFDTTTLSFYGAYEREGLGSGYDGPPPPKVTFGHSKAKRPDLKQVVFGCLSTPDGGVPLLGKVLDGNCADSLAAAEFFGRVRELVSDPRKVCLVADSKGWCDRTLDVVTAGGMRLLSRMPRSERLHRELMEKPWSAQATIDRPGRGKAGMERYEIMGFDVEREITVSTGEKKADGTPVTQKRSIPVRALRVYSTALLKTKVATLDRTREQEARRALSQIRDWQSIVYACASDAQRAADRHIGQYDAITHDLHAEIVHHIGPAQRGRGRPRKRPEPALDAAEHWRVRYRTEPVSESDSQRRLHDHASFILIRTRSDDWQITDAEMIDHYRNQHHLEHGFSWLKSGADINPMFIETPQRIAAMGFIYCIGLMTWNLIQRTVRANLVATKTGLPYHRRKLSSNITTRFLIELFPSVQTIVLTTPDGKREKRTLGMEEWQSKAASALGVAPNAFKPVLPKSA